MSLSMIVTLFRFGLVAMDAGWGVYLVAMPQEQVLTNPIWREAIRLLPAHDLTVLGFLFLIGPVLAGGSAFLSVTHVVGRVGWILAGLGIGVAGAAWGLTAVSWTDAASRLDGQGAGSAWLALGLVFLHGVLAFQRQTRAGNRRSTDRR